MLNWLFPILLIASKTVSFSPVLPSQVLNMVAAVSMQDSLALVALYDSTNGPGWKNKWILKNPVSTWYGVSTSSGSVVSINLDKNNLNGRLPTQLGNLSKLKEFHIDSNSISGQIPETFWNITTLQMVDLQRNKLSGSLSKSIANLTQLTYARFSYNLFDGPLPAEIADLSLLNFLYFAGNQFKGTIPSNYSKLSRLIQFSVEGNKLTGEMPAFFGGFTSLNLLHLHRNNFSGTIPAEYGNMTSLEECFLGLNPNVTGPIPSSLGNLMKLKILGLNYMNLSGTVPINFGKLSVLEVLYLDNNSNLGGTIPDELGNLTTLKRIDLSNCQFTGAVPATFSRLNLVQFSVCNNDLTSLPIMNGANIKTICISRNQFTFDDIMAAFKSLPKSAPNVFYSPQDSIFKDTLISKKEGEMLALGFKIDTNKSNVYRWFKSPNNTQPWKTISGTDSLLFSALQPSDAGVYRVKVTNAFAPSLTLESRKITIQVRPKVDTSSCRYKDSLELIKLYRATNGPNWRIRWDTLQPLKKWHGVTLNANGCVTCLDLDTKNDCIQTDTLGNNLDGQLPNLNLPSLQYLFLFRNNLTGPIPDLNLPNLKSLVLSSNRFSGEIPNFSHLTQLELLYISGNRLLQGKIPAFDSLKLLKYLHLNQDNLTGSIPNFASKEFVDLSLFDNNLTGPVPDFNYANLKILRLNDNKLSGGIENLDLKNVQDFRLNGNELSDLSAFTLLKALGTDNDKFDSLLFYGNKLTFEDILPNMSLITKMGSRARYAPQDSIYHKDNVSLKTGETFRINLKIDSLVSSNLYQWYKDGQPFGAPLKVNTFILNNLKLSDAGIYHVKVTNPNAPALTLYSWPIVLNVTCSANTQAKIVSSFAKDSICAGSSLTLTASGGSAYLWQDGQTTAAINEIVKANKSFRVSITDAFGCTQTLVKDIVQLANPIVSISSPSNVFCPGNNLTLTATFQTNLTYRWKRNNAFVGQASTQPNYTVTTAGVYSVVAQNTQGCSSTSNDFSIRNGQIYPADFSPSHSKICPNEKVTFTAQVSPNAKYEWLRNNSSVQNSVGLNTYSTDQKGSYVLKVTSGDGCSSVSPVYNLVPSSLSDSAKLMSSISSDTLCPNANLNLLASGGNSYRWQDGQTNPSINESIKSNKTYQVTISDGACSVVLSKKIIVAQIPEITAKIVESQCSYKIQASVNGGKKPYAYLWNTGYTGLNIPAITTGKYELMVKDARLCSIKKSIEVDSFSLLEGPTLVTTPACGEKSGSIEIKLKPGRGPYQIEWFPNTVGSGENPRKELSIGNYSAVIMDLQGCTDTVHVEMKSSDCNEKYRVFEAFTPNGDNFNDQFEIRPLDCAFSTLAECFPDNELIIFNRNNHVIFRRSPYNNDWDGEGFPAGSYIYSFFSHKGDKKTGKQGWVYLVK